MLILDGDLIGGYILLIRRFLICYVIFYLVITLLLDTLNSNKQIGKELGVSKARNEGVVRIKYGMFHFIVDVILTLPFILTSILVMINHNHVDLNTIVVYAIVLVISIVYNIVLVLMHINFYLEWTEDKNTLIVNTLFNKKVVVDLDTISKINKCLYYDVIVYNNKETIIINNKVDYKNMFIDSIIRESLNRNPFMVVK